MATVKIEGEKPLSGTVKVAGSKKIAARVLYACAFSNEDIILENVPRIEDIEADLFIIKNVGGTVEWVGQNKLKLNCSTISKFEIPLELGSRNRLALLLVPALIYRFGKATVPKPKATRILRGVQRIVAVWTGMGYTVTEDDDFYYVLGQKVYGAPINFEVSTTLGTTTALFCGLFADGETTIKNPTLAYEDEELISFCTQLGGEISYGEGGTLKLVGKNVFKGINFKIKADINEIVLFSTAALMTKGNIIIKDVEKPPLLSFVNTLTKMGCKFEFYNSELRVWYSGEAWTPLTISTGFAPSLPSDWQPYVTLLLTQATGEGSVYETIYIDRFDYVYALDKMGAKIVLAKPVELGLPCVVCDELYDVKTAGEPRTLAKISGPTKLRGTELRIEDLRGEAVLVVAALSAAGESLLSGYEHIIRGYESLLEKLKTLGADIDLVY